MKKYMQYKITENKLFLFVIGVLLIMLMSCTSNSVKDKKQSKKREDTSEWNISEDDFFSVPNSYKPWVYYWWLKGNVTKELISRDLEEMKNKGIGGFLLFDSRGYHDGFEDGLVPVPLKIKYEFMSPGWREMVKHAMQEASRLGLKMSINLANTGGSLRGPWAMEEQGPKQLIWTGASVSGPSKLSVQLDKPADKEYFQDVTLMAVQIDKNGLNEKEIIELNSNWKEVTEPTENALEVGKVINLKDKIYNGKLQWDVPDGKWEILRFGYHVIGDKGSVDILNSDAVSKYFQLMGDEILKDAGSLAGETLTHFYNVSWEGGQPNWTSGFEKEFQKYRGYDISQYMPMLTGMVANDSNVYNRFMHDYLKTISDCFKTNCYETIGDLCHAKGIQWHSENGGPWPRNAPMFKEADQLTFWGKNDMPQGEFWCSTMNDLNQKSNVRFTAMASHVSGQPLVAVEAFTHMGAHWTKYPAYLKPFADLNFIDGANFFIWHTFTASPFELGKPGFEYFAGTHVNPNVTWWNESGNFFGYLGRCQYLLRKGEFSADVCSYVSNKNYTNWGRGEKWNDKSILTLDKGYSYDLIDSEALVSRMTVENGKLMLPNGMTYKVLVVDLKEPEISSEVIKKIKELVHEGATIILGQCKPTHTPGIKNFLESDEEIIQLANELWGNEWEKPQIRMVGKGKIYTGTKMDEVLKDENILPDFNGPFEYIHRRSDIQDIYFISGEGEADCTFRMNNKKPEIWNPASGQVTDALSYRFTNDGRTIVPLNLPENGSLFIVFRKKAEEDHVVSMNGPVKPEVVIQKEKSMKVIIWESGDYSFNISNGDEKKISATVDSPVELTELWEVSFEQEKSTPIKTTFEKLVLWNEHSNPWIKYFSGTAIYQKSFSLTEEQATKKVRLQLGKVFNISRVWLNGNDLGVIWTAPWQIDLTNAIKPGTNELKIEVTNCWSNRLIGDASLSSEKRSTNTNVRLVLDRKKYPRIFQAISATDSLMPSGLLGPVSVEFGVEKNINF